MAYKFRISFNSSGRVRNIRSMPNRIQKNISYLYAKWLVKTGRVLKWTRSHNGVPKMLEKSAIKELLYGGISEILNNRHYYYHSSIGAEYSHFTDAGKVAMTEYLNIIGDKMIKAEEASLNKRAKDLIINGLKGETV